MEMTKATENALEQILKLGRGLAIREVAEFAQAAETAGGTLVAVEPDDDGRCGNGRVIFKWPLPKNDQFEKFLGVAVKNRIQMHILINGIPFPDELQIEFDRSIRSTMTH